MPDDFLDRLDPVARAEWWRDHLAGDDASSTTLVVEDGNGSVVGMATVGPARGEGESDLGELWMINVLPDAWGSAAGTELLHAAVDVLRDGNWTEAVLWVVEGNARARRFYEREGWFADGAAQVDESYGFPVREVRYRIALHQ